MFSKRMLLHGNDPGVDLSYWLQNTYPDTYDSITSLSTSDKNYLNSVKASSMNHMFSNGMNLANLSGVSLCTDYTTNMSYMFSNCIKLTSVDGSAWNTSNVTDMSYMFYVSSSMYNTSLTSINCSNWNTSKVTTMYAMFRLQKSLTSLNVSAWNTSSLTTMYYMFYYCNNLKSLDMSSWNTSNVTNMAYTFSCIAGNEYGRISNKSVTLDLSGFDTTNVTTMNGMFADSYVDYLIINSTTVKFQMKNSNCGNLNTECKILVPASALNTYKTATNWSSRASQFDSISNYTITRSNGQVTVTPN